MNFDRAVQALCDAGVDFIIIGGWSAILHGSANVTSDLDIFFARRQENLRRLVQALEPYRPRLTDLPERLPFIWDEATLSNGTIFTLTTELGRIDLLGEVSGLGSYKEVEATSLIVEAFGRQVRTLDLRSLIAAKRAAGREKDLRALPELESLLEAQAPRAPNQAEQACCCLRLEPDWPTLAASTPLADPLHTAPQIAKRSSAHVRGIVHCDCEADFAHPHQYAEGLRHVLVNGKSGPGAN